MKPADAAPALSERQRWSRLARLQRLLDDAINTNRPRYWQDTVMTLCAVACGAGVLACWFWPAPGLCAVLVAVAGGVFMKMFFRQRPAYGWSSRLQAELADYLPASRPAYDRLMHALAQSEHASPDMLRQWLIEERMAIAGVGGFRQARAALARTRQAAC